MWRDLGSGNRVLAAVSLVFVVAGFCSPGFAASYMSGEEIRQVLSGNTIESPTGSWRVYFDPSGENRAQEGEIKDKGTWEVFDDHYCARWDNWVDGKLLCWKLKWKQKGERLTRQSLIDR